MKDHQEHPRNESLLALAVENNVALYEAVLGGHGLHGERTEACWWSASKPPPYYGNMVALSRKDPKTLMDRVDWLIAHFSESAFPFAIKDSFAALDPQALEARAFTRLFEARWYGLPEARSISGAPSKQHPVARVRNAQDLSAWEAQWQQTSPAPGLRVFPPVLLEDPHLDFVRVGDVGGALLNRSRNTIGLSNVFPADPDIHRAVARHAAHTHPDRAVVGYGDDEDLEALGFEVLGELRVWQRTARGPR